MACRDRLAELLASSANNSPAPKGNNSDGSTRSVRSLSAASSDPWRASDIGDFLEEVNKIRGQILALETQIDRLEHKHTDMIMAISRNEQKVLGEDVSETVVDITTRASRIRASLRAMDDDNKAFERTARHEHEHDEVGGIPADVRIRSSQHAALSRKFAATMLRFAEIRDATAARRAQLASRMHEIGLDGKTSPEAHETTALVGVSQCVQLEAEWSLSEVQERHRDLAKLEQDMTELHAMFVDLSLLVEEQGELLDRIDLNVDRAAVYVDHGLGELKQARKLKSSIRKKSFAIGTVVVVACAAVAAAITAPLKVLR